MILTVILGDPPWEAGQTFEARFPVTLEVIWATPPWEVGRKLTATMDEPESEPPEVEPESVRE